MLPNIGPLELAVVVIIALLVLGPKKLPEVGRSIGHGIREFKGSISEKAEPAKPLEGDAASHTAGPVLEGEIVQRRSS
jgi:sec-independent protein translocase protein TatA